MYLHVHSTEDISDQDIAHTPRTASRIRPGDPCQIAIKRGVPELCFLGNPNGLFCWLGLAAQFNSVGSRFLGTGDWPTRLPKRRIAMQDAALSALCSQRFASGGAREQWPSTNTTAGCDSRQSIASLSFNGTCKAGNIGRRVGWFLDRVLTGLFAVSNASFRVPSQICCRRKHRPHPARKWGSGKWGLDTPPQPLPS
jgi:hypothetical protein